MNTEHQSGGARGSGATFSAPKSFRLHIGIFGRRNVGKSSVLNALTRQQVSIVSEHAGTTTDPVEKPMELLPLGPVLFIDTAGIDDEGALGELRVLKTRSVFDRVDMALVVSEAGAWGAFEGALAREFAGRKVPVIGVLNKEDLRSGAPVPEDGCGVRFVTCSTTSGNGLGDLRQALLDSAPPGFFESRPMLSDLVPPGELAVLVVPIDKEAPKGRIILPQVQAIRDLLDGDAGCVVIKEHGLKAVLERLTVPPKLVVTDSQAFLKVAADTPPQVPLTSFSILLSRLQGGLNVQVAGTAAIDALKDGDSILVAEACTHHPIDEDIGRVKIPKWLRQKTGAELRFEHVQGRDFPQHLSQFSLVVHCGNCMGSRREMLSRIMRCAAQGVPITNYGLAIAYSLGIFERALGPFPDAMAIYRGAAGRGGL